MQKKQERRDEENVTQQGVLKGAERRRKGQKGIRRTRNNVNTQKN